MVDQTAPSERLGTSLEMLAAACDRIDRAFAVVDPVSGEEVFRNKAFSKLSGEGAMDWRGYLPLRYDGEESADSAAGSGVTRFGFRFERLSTGHLLVVPTEPAPGTAGLVPEGHDPLTGLPGGRILRDRLAALDGEGGDENETALLVVNIERFQNVNETLGHAVGDRLLLLIARRLGRILRESEIIARLDGATFAVVDRSARRAESAKALAARIVEIIGRPYLVAEHVVNVGVKVGVALRSTDGPDGETLLKSAELALLGAKTAGGGPIRFFDQEMDRRAQLRRSIETDLRRALAMRELELVYQPILAVASGRPVAAEALLRWRHPTRGMVPPAAFIPVAEETDLIGPIGDWVLRNACRDAASWPGEVSVAVNLSPVQMRRRGLVDSVKAALAESGLPAPRLELEITEGVLLDRSEATLGMLHELRALGVKIAMDDFGTGYSSLGYLRAFPFDKVKIDQSFVRHMEEDREAAAVVSAVIGIGASLGITITAEGVETPEQLERLRAEGCGEVQGWLIGRPVDSAGLAVFLHGSPAGAVA